MKETLAPLAGCDGYSKCYACAYYDWAIVLGLEQAWQHQCNSALECTPGDNVVTCEGFKDEISD